MKALVYHGPGKKAWETVPSPRLKAATDAIVRMDTTTICGTDLHILKGDVPAVTDGRILGHEGVGTITEVGTAVKGLKAGDRVIASCISSCGSCSGSSPAPIASTSTPSSRRRWAPSSCAGSRAGGGAPTRPRSLPASRWPSSRGGRQAR